MDIVLIYSVRL